MAAVSLLGTLLVGGMGLGFGYWKGWQHALQDSRKPGRLGRIMEAATSKQKKEGGKP